jgi:hypothetical protein
VDEYRSVLADYITLCNDHPEVKCTILAGDFNTDFSRLNSLHTHELNQFITMNDLYSCISCDCAAIKHTYENVHTYVMSTLDQFILSDNLFQSISEYCSIHCGANLSDHCPVLLRLSMSTEHMTVGDAKQFVSRPSWRRANDNSIAHYKADLDAILHDIQIPYDAIHCNTLHCSKHGNDIDSYCNSLIDACIKATDQCIPRTRKKGLPGWNEHVKESRDESMFWHSIWVQCGRPTGGIIASIRRSTRARYHQVVKRLKSQENQLRADKMANAFMSENNRDLWNEVKRIDGRCNIIPKIVDGQQNDKDISNVFAEKYRKLYNCVGYDRDEMYHLYESLNESITSKCMEGQCYDSHHISLNCVTDAIGKLKPNKSDGTYILLSDSLIHSCRSLHLHLSLLFTTMLRHGVAPRNMSLSTIIPIPKNSKKCLSDSANYRGIALGSLLGKILDNILLCNNVNILQSSDMQFGFKPKHSTTQCTFVLNEITDYYLRHDSSIYLVLLDASQAFDRVQYVKMFRLLIQRGICPLTARFLANWYTNQFIRVSWNGHISNSFTTSNGVKQGAILSPILFCVYMDVLLSKLKKF